MSGVAKQLGEEVASRVLDEAVDEVAGRSNRKWAVVLLALLIGAAAAAFVLKVRSRRADGELAGPR